MRHSVIGQAGGSRFVPLRPDFVLICDGNPCAALLLAVFDWRCAQAANASEGDVMLAWVPASMPWLSSWLADSFGERAMKTGLELLVEAGFVDRRQVKGRDRTYEYRLNSHAVICRLEELHPGGFQADVCSDVAGASLGSEEPKERTKEPGATSAPDGPSSPSPTLPGLDPAPTQPKGGAARGDADEVWEHYVEVMQPRRTDLMPQERSLINGALKVATKDELKFAITGCSCSPHHMGKNDRRKKYNALSQIIKGKQGGKTQREQIDMMIGYAESAGKTRTTVAGSGDTLTTRQLIDHAPPLLAPKVKQRVQDILTARRHPDRDGAIDWGAKAERMMLEDFKVRPIFDGQGEDTLITGWERA